MTILRLWGRARAAHVLKVAWGVGELGMAYLGTQGDVWDAHKDMALASLGATIAMLITAAINARLRRGAAASTSGCRSTTVTPCWPTSG